MVERIIQKIINEKIDIDNILLVTFTNAAASEMRERILEAIYKKIEETPDDINLQRQITLLNKASICTIHSFCLDVIKNNFYEIDISPNFRIGDTAEIELLKQDVLEEVFENKYINMDEDFLKLIDIYTGYRGDETLKEIILEIYKYIQSSPFPEEWIKEKVEMFNIKDTNKDFSQTIWGKILLEDYRNIILETKTGFKSVKKKLDKNPELDKFSIAIQSDINKLCELEENLDSWERTYELSNKFSFNKWPIDRKITSNIKDEAKIIRDKINKKFKLEKDKILIYNSKEANEDISSMYTILKLLSKNILEFSDEFTKKKREKNIIDFNDIEHLALKILVEKDGRGNYIATKAAEKYKDKFVEIAIDEYQDSNLVQEYILNAISRGNNIFMVGDVKQSIYKFRQARPELFLEKYREYKLKDKKTDKDNLKIQLFKNFRSRKNILDITNLIFKDIMSSKLGDVDYNEFEYLNLGARYEEPEESVNYAGKSELHIIDLKCEEANKDKLQEEAVEEERIEDTVLEARFVANKIQELLNSKYQVYDRKKGYRPITYKDIVVLLRATSVSAPIYEEEISKLDFPVYSDTSSEYLNSIEIQTIMCVLKIIDNPMQDIPLVTVLRSMIGGFTDNELIEIRLADRYCNFYEAIMKAKIQVSEGLKQKIEIFFGNIEKWRKMQEYLSLDELIWQIYLDTGYYNYVGLMPGGMIRQANLKMLFERAREYEAASFKGLFNFINFIDKLKLSSGDLGAAKIIGENENVIRIMSIHKSKGLEFPVVFLCGTGKKFNMQDLNDNILLDQDIGIGPKYINYERKIEYNTLAKEAIKKKVKLETLSEEMRVLYVALTRAKEKLIITGLSKYANKEIEQKKELLMMYDNASKINFALVSKYKSYLDWIELVYLNNKDNIDEILSLNIQSKSDIMKKNSKDEKIQEDSIYNIIEMLKSKSNKKTKVEDILNWSYENIISTKIPSKASVTKIKEMQKNGHEIEEIKYNKNLDKITSKPKFLQDKVELTNAEKGTLIHLCMQKLDVKNEYNLDSIKSMIEKMVAKDIITQKEAESINIKKIYNFTRSKLWKEMKEAKIIEREKPFYINIPAKEIYNENAQENVLVQGIIDLYYISKNDEIVLVDYKTDYVENRDENILKNKYKEQLNIYKRALEESLKKKVEHVYIYSVYMDKEIQM